MGKIKLGYWFLTDNSASVSLMNLHAEVKILNNNEFIYFQLTITDSNMETANFNFYTLEDAVTFVENVASKCSSKEEVSEKYNDMLNQGLFKLPCEIKPPKENVITLSLEELKQILLKYYSRIKKGNISINIENYIDFNKKPKIVFYLIEYMEYYGIQNILTEKDIEKVLINYLDFYGYELVNYEYKEEMNSTSDLPMYNCININVVSKEDNNQKKYQKKLK